MGRATPLQRIYQSRQRKPIKSVRREWFEFIRFIWDKEGIGAKKVGKVMKHVFFDKDGKRCEEEIIQVV